METCFYCAFKRTWFICVNLFYKVIETIIRTAGVDICYIIHNILAYIHIVDLLSKYI